MRLTTLVSLSRRDRDRPQIVKGVVEVCGDGEDGAVLARLALAPLALSLSASDCELVIRHNLLASVHALCGFATAAVVDSSPSAYVVPHVATTCVSLRREMLQLLRLWLLQLHYDVVPAPGDVDDAVAAVAVARSALFDGVYAVVAGQIASAVAAIRQAYSSDASAQGARTVDAVESAQNACFLLTSLLVPVRERVASVVFSQLVNVEALLALLALGEPATQRRVATLLERLRPHLCSGSGAAELVAHRCSTLLAEWALPLPAVTADMASARALYAACAPLSLVSCCVAQLRGVMSTADSSVGATQWTTAMTLLRRLSAEWASRLTVATLEPCTADMAQLCSTLMVLGGQADVRTHTTSRVVLLSCTSCTAHD